MPFLCGGLFVSRVTLKVRNRLQLHLAGSEFERKGGFPLKISSDYRAFLKRLLHPTERETVGFAQLGRSIWL